MSDVAEMQEDLSREVIGPPERVAFDDGGNPTKAAIGFAKNQGVEPGDLIVVETEKGRYIAAKKHETGRPAKDVLEAEIPKWITSLPFPKSMRWKDLNIRFTRPIHWIAALLGPETLSFEIETIRSGNRTRGHRFLSPGDAVIPKPSDYVSLCRSLNVVVDPEERQETILNAAREAAKGFSGKLVEDPDLVKITANLVEYPVIVAGSFDPEFLEIPREVLITSMREHQKFFSVEDEAGKLLPHFVNVSNMKADSMEMIRRGNERVLRARLSDARFFYREDQKRRLEDRVEDLKGVVFHAKLGTSYEKVERIRALAKAFAKRIAPELEADADRAAFLCKADLSTEMVGEFPTLQGVMGRRYAEIEGEKEAVVAALHEHYLPAFSGDRLPSGPVGAFVALADKTDTISGCFGVGEIPSGAGDPFGLRRAALGVLHILLEKGWGLPLGDMTDEALSVLGNLVKGDPAEVRSKIMDFFRVRLGNYWIAQGRNQEAVEAVVATGFDNLPETYLRLEALEAFMSDADFENLALSFKRVLNIVQGAEPGPVDAGLFEQPEEGALWEAVGKAESQVGTLMMEKAPLKALQSLSELRPIVDAFFDAVLVNAKDMKVRENRLRMLATLGAIFLKLADFSKITTRPA